MPNWIDKIHFFEFQMQLDLNLTLSFIKLSSVLLLYLLRIFMKQRLLDWNVNELENVLEKGQGVYETPYREERLHLRFMCRWFWSLLHL